MIDEAKKIKHELYEIKIEIQRLKKLQKEKHIRLDHIQGEKKLIRKRK